MKNEINSIDPQQLADVLCRVKVPGRYIGHEANSIYKDYAKVSFSVCLPYTFFRFR